MSKRNFDAAQDAKRLERQAQTCDEAAKDVMYYERILKILDKDLETWRQQLGHIASAGGAWKLMFVSDFCPFLVEKQSSCIQNVCAMNTKFPKIATRRATYS